MSAGGKSKLLQLVLVWLWLCCHIADGLACGQYEINVGGWFNRRSALVYVPQALCMNNVQPAGVVMAFHCWGCSADLELKKWTASADLLNVVLIAPEGVEASFNAVECCGPARTRQLNDIGTAQEMAQLVLNNLAYAPNPNKSLTMQRVLMVGSSNGGFMTSYAAIHGGQTPGVWTPAGIVASAGHISKVPPPIPGKALPVWIQHGTADVNVNFNGCCPQHGCCCDITQTPVCHGAEDHFEWWLKRNRCNGRESIAFKEEPLATCYRGLECAAETRFCSFQGYAHEQFLSRAPFATESLSVLLGYGDLQNVSHPSDVSGSVPHASNNLGQMLLPKAAVCTDDHPSCPGWASEGECKQNSGYMLVHCRKSCNSCGEVYQGDLAKLEQKNIIPHSVLEPILQRMQETHPDRQTQPFNFFATMLLLVAFFFFLALWRHHFGALFCCVSGQSRGRTSLSLEEDQQLYSIVEAESQ